MEYREVLIFKVREKISCIKLLSIIAVFLDWKISEILVFLQLGVINWFKKLFSLLKRVVEIIILKCLTRSTVLGLWIKGHVFFDIWHIYSRATQLVVTNYLPPWTTQMDGPKKHVFQWIPSKETLKCCQNCLPMDAAWTYSRKIWQALAVILPCFFLVCHKCNAHKNHPNLGKNETCFDNEILS